MHYTRPILFLLLFFVQSTLSGQQILLPGSQWIYEHNSYPSSGIHTQTIETITVREDTTINGLLYSIVNATKEAPCSIFSRTEYLREESNRIYRRAKYHDMELLMLDMNLQNQYELQFESPVSGLHNIETGIAIVDSFGVEEVYDGHEFEVHYMRILNNQSFDDDALYKVYNRIGFVQYGILFPDLGTGLCDISENIRLRCHILGQDTVRFTQFDCFESSLINADHEIGDLAISLFPNPTSDLIYIPAELKVNEIVNMCGQKLAVHVNENVLDFRDFPAGLYMIRLSSGRGDQAYMCKILKI